MDNMGEVWQAIEEQKMLCQWGDCEAMLHAIFDIPSAHSGMKMDAYRRLGQIYFILDDHERAFEVATASVALYPERDTVSFAEALQMQAKAALTAGHIQTARTAVETALSILRGNWMSRFEVARALVISAACSFAESNLEKAKFELKDAWPVLQSALDPPGPSAVDGAGQWWGLVGTMRWQSRDFEGAVLAYREAIDYRRLLDGMPHLAGPVTRKKLSNALYALGCALSCRQDSEAESVFAESEAICAEINAPPRPRNPSRP